MFDVFAEFYTRGNLNRHNKTVHSKVLDEDFVCDECPFRTKFKYNLGVHHKSVHNSNKLNKIIKKKRKKCLKRQTPFKYIMSSNAIMSSNE